MKNIRDNAKSIYEKQQDAVKENENKGKYIDKKI